MLSFKHREADEPGVFESLAHIRIAIPSWNWHWPLLQINAPERTLSREELQRLFDSDLNGLELFEKRRSAVKARKG